MKQRIKVLCKIVIFCSIISACAAFVSLIFFRNFATSYEELIQPTILDDRIILIIFNFGIASETFLFVISFIYVFLLTSITAISCTYKQIFS